MGNRYLFGDEQSNMPSVDENELPMREGGAECKRKKLIRATA
jgi:hypothetical protein